MAPSQLQQLPPLRLFSTGCYVSHDEVELFATTPKAQGHPMHHRCFTALPHDFCLYSGGLASAAEAVTKIADELSPQRSYES